MNGLKESSKVKDQQLQVVAIVTQMFPQDD